VTYHAYSVLKVTVWRFYNLVFVSPTNRPTPKCLVLSRDLNRDIFSRDRLEPLSSEPRIQTVYEALAHPWLLTRMCTHVCVDCIVSFHMDESESSFSTDNNVTRWLDWLYDSIWCMSLAYSNISPCQIDRQWAMWTIRHSVVDVVWRVSCNSSQKTSWPADLRYSAPSPVPLSI